MHKREPLVPLLAALRDLAAWLKAAQVSGIVIGGVAASLLGRPRVTRDVDALVILEEDRWAGFLSSGRSFGFIPRRSDALAFARKARALLLRHEPSHIDIDIAFGALPFEVEAVTGAKSAMVAGVRIPLPAPEDLIIMKAVSHRPRDLVDIEAVLDAHPKMDVRRIRRWVRAFATSLETPDILADLNRLLAIRRTTKRR